MSKTVAIAGIGWMGKPFALRLQVLGYRVKGSVTSLQKATELQQGGIDAYPIEISEDGVSGPAQKFLSDVDYLVIMIPPGLRRNTGANYVLKMKHFLSEIQKSSIANLVLVSSTSVYSDSQGEVTEKNLPEPNSIAGKQLLEVEKMFSSAEGLKVSIVRFGGLFGGGRQPARYLAGRKSLRNGNAPVNLIHREDCIGILTEIIKQEAFGHIFNAVIPQHPIKAVYYSNKAIELGLTPPTYSEENELEVFKQVDSERIDLVLGYDFQHLLN